MAAFWKAFGLRGGSPVDEEGGLIACREFSWQKLHANGVIHDSPGLGREAVATPGSDGIAMELQGSSDPIARIPGWRLVPRLSLG